MITEEQIVERREKLASGKSVDAENNFLILLNEFERVLAAGFSVVGRAERAETALPELRELNINHATCDCGKDRVDAIIDATLSGGAR